MTKKELWLRIKNYHFDHIVPPNMWGKVQEVFGGTDASTRAFADKISRKHNCTKRYALKAVHEYKKFLYLAVISDFHVTPSKTIDKVWHEHILFTQAYRAFCDEVIEYNLNHHPELFVLAAQTERYHAQYLDTLDLYVKEFGILPTDDVWDITKYDKEQILEKLETSRKKRSEEELYHSDTSYSSDIPLYQSFDRAEGPSKDFPEFNGFDGGETGGGGAEGSWDSDNYIIAEDSEDSNIGDDGGGDGDDGDSDGGDSGGCSSGCGGD
jgi:hypothetical protein